MGGAEGVEGFGGILRRALVGDELGIVEMDEAPAVVDVVTRLLVPGHGALAVGAEHLDIGGIGHFLESRQSVFLNSHLELPLEVGYTCLQAGLVPQYPP
jgi:hypothetical protein